MGLFDSVFRPTRLRLDAAFTGLVVACAWCLQMLSYFAGYSLNPTLSRVMQIIAFWMLIIGGSYVLLPLTTLGQSKKSVAARISLCAICWCTMCFPAFRTNQGFAGFIRRVKRDVQPARLSEFLRTQASSGFQWRKIAPVEWSLFSTNREARLPWLVNDKEGAMLQWGTDFELWRVARLRAHPDDLPWDGDLFLCKLEK